MAMKFIERAL